MGISCSTPNEGSSTSLRRTKGEQSGRGKKCISSNSVTSSSGVDVKVSPGEVTSGNCLAPTSTDILPKSDSPDIRSLIPSEATITPECLSNSITPKRVRRTVSSLNNIPEYVFRLLKGQPTEIDLKPKVIRLFVVACSSDSISERTVLERDIFPKLNVFCSENDYCLELVDNNWQKCCHLAEIRRELAKDLLSHYIQTSSLVIILILLNNKIEYSIPRLMSSTDFNDILDRLDSGSEEHTLLQSSYTKTQTKTYKLSPCAKCVQTTFNSECDRLGRLLVLFQKHMTKSQAKIYLQSAQGDEIHSILSTSSHISPSEIILVNRNFIRVKDLKAPNFINMNGNEIDKVSQETIKQLKKKIESTLPPTNVLRHSVSWKSQSTEIDDKEYLAKFTSDVLNLTLTVIRNHIESDDRVWCNSYIGINHRLYEELLNQTRLLQTFISLSEENSCVITRLKAYLQDKSRYPMVIHGPPGSEKTSVIAQIATECSRLLPDAASLLRFCSMTPFTCSMLTVFHSLIQQVDYLNDSSGKHIKGELPQRPFPHCSEQASFQTLIGLATPLQPLVILLDHVTVDKDSWFVTKLPAHVKMIITVQSKSTVDYLKKELSKEICFIELPEYKAQTTSFVTSILTPCIPVEDSDSSDINTDMLFELMEKQFGYDLVSEVLRLLVIAKLGMTTAEIVDILSDVYSASKSDTAMRHIRSTWHSIRCCLLPFINTCHHKRSVLHLWKSQSLKIETKKRYLAAETPKKKQSSIDDDGDDGDDGDDDGVDYKPILVQTLTFGAENVSSLSDLRHTSYTKTTHKQICDYLACRWNDTLGKNTSQLLNIAGNNLIYELPYHCILCGKKGKSLLDAIVFNPDWLAASIDATSSIDLINILQFIQKECYHDDLDMETMLQVIWLSHEALDMDENQIYSQCLIRLSSVMHKPTRLPNISKLFNVCRESKVKHLVSSKICLARDMKEADRRAQSEDESMCNLYVIGPGGSLVASLFEEKGEIVIWNLESGDKMKTLSDLNHPRALSMIDEQRAVVLCDRELIVYDLEEQTVIRQLRGVLNLKMPLFSVPNEQNVVALSRNRMYVNVIAIETGEMVATFKAGEDRFLDSLLVSRNGQVLVCGDATQKPSPLLVWNLEESRLVHDLRMAQHEFITGIADITDDGHYVVCACIELDKNTSNFLVAYDLISGQLFKVFKTTRNTTCLSTHVRLNCVVSGLETGDFIVWDMVSGNKKFNIRGVGACFNHLALAMDTTICVSYYTGDNRQPEARTICLWDFKHGNLIASFTFDCTPTCAVMSPDGRKVIVGLPGYEDIVVLRLK